MTSAIFTYNTLLSLVSQTYFLTIRQEQTSLLNHCLSTQKRPHVRPCAMPRAVFSFTNNTVDKEYNPSYPFTIDSYSKTIASYRSYYRPIVLVIELVPLHYSSGWAKINKIMSMFSLLSQLLWPSCKISFSLENGRTNLTPKQ